MRLAPERINLTSYRYIFVVLVIFLVLISAVYLRREENTAFYRFRSSQVKTARLKQQLWQKQLQLENYINPASVSEIVKDKTN
ncbi:MAG: hypothetical protein KJ757_05345 [Planctomycetes bacterium]|nr:hypothetical protein [Planctomycetota bacterium]MBU1518860.1 hypothetical protein [Planctomycetota bacterium]MBU2457147.1 hypothetical protein [Planctomycetota bacterium]MBU2596963.1 hypothetical protein [Planctomycetota bacterium]